MHKEKIGIVGLGKLGLPMLAAFVSRGFDAYGYDINSELIKTLKKNINPYEEPGLKEVIQSDSHSWSSRFFENLRDLTQKVDVLFLIVPTPSKKEDATFDTSYLQATFDAVSSAANEVNKQIICVITSTVNPGDTEVIATRAIQATNGRLSVVYSPEFIALGSVLRDMLNPDIVLLGGNNDEALDKIFSIYSRLYKTYPEFHRLSYFEAETAKIAINTYVTTKISFANTIGMFVENRTGSRKSAQKVLNAVGGDSRIGRKYFLYGGSYGGPCFPRDNRALAAHLKSASVPAQIPNATDGVNEDVLNFWENKIANDGYDAIVLVGVAYKAGTNFLEESFMLRLAERLNNKISIYFYDPIVKAIDGIRYITPDTASSQLSQYTKPLIIRNYGDFQFEEVSQNTHWIDLWN